LPAGTGKNHDEPQSESSHMNYHLRGNFIIMTAQKIRVYFSSFVGIPNIFNKKV
jgi:hypothetical protein